MDLELALQRLLCNNNNDNNNNNKIKEKAEEYIRLSFNFCRNLENGECGRSVICLLLAFEHFHVYYNEKDAFRISGIVKEQTFKSTLLQLRNKLISTQTTTTTKTTGNALSFNDLGIKFGCISLVKHAQLLFRSYKEKVLSATTEYQREATAIHFNNSSNCFICASFYVAVKKEKVRVDRKALVKLSNVSETEFKRICADIAKLVQEEEEKEKKKEEEEEKEEEKVVKKQKIEEPPKEEEEDDDDDDDDNTDRFNVHLKRKRDAYENWKQSILNSKS